MCVEEINPPLRSYTFFEFAVKENSYLFWQETFRTLKLVYTPQYKICEEDVHESFDNFKLPNFYMKPFQWITKDQDTPLKLSSHANSGMELRRSENPWEGQR